MEKVIETESSSDYIDGSSSDYDESEDEIIRNRKIDQSGQTTTQPTDPSLHHKKSNFQTIFTKPKERPKIDLAEIRKCRPEPDNGEIVPGQNMKFPQSDFIQLRIVQLGLCSKKVQNMASYRYGQKKYMRPKGVVIMLHGFTSHANRNVHIAEKFVQKGYDVCAFDYLGHGKSDGGGKAFIESESNQILQCRLFVKQVVHFYKRELKIILSENQKNGIPLILLGVSLGGALAVKLALMKENRKKFSLLLLFNASLRLWPRSKILLMFGQMMNYVIPRWHVLPRNRDLGARCRSQQKAYNKDDLIYKGRLQIQSVYSMLDLISSVQKEMGGLETPFVIAQSGKDKIVNPNGAWDLYQTAKTPFKDIFYYPDIWHDIFRDRQWEQVIDDVINVIPNYIL